MKDLMFDLCRGVEDFDTIYKIYEDAAFRVIINTSTGRFKDHPFLKDAALEAIESLKQSDHGLYPFQSSILGKIVEVFESKYQQK